MTVLHLTSRAGPDGKVHLGEMDVGIPGAMVNITVAVEARVSDEQWKKEMRELLDSMGDIHVESYPRMPMNDPWSES